MLEYEENCLEEYRPYVPYSLQYDEEQSLNEIEYALNKGNLDEYVISDFTSYLKYLKSKLAGILSMERSEGNDAGDLPKYIERVQDLLSQIAGKPFF